MRFSLQGKGKMKCDQLQWLQCSLRLAGATSIGGRVAPDNSWEGQEGARVWGNLPQYYTGGGSYTRDFWI